MGKLLSIIGLTGGALGAIMGAFLIHASKVVAGAALGFHVPYLLPLRVIGLCVLASVALACLAGLLPALRAGRGNIAEAVRME